MKFGKRQLVMAGLVLALGAAVYLNWHFSNNTDLLSPASSVTTSKELGQAQFVNNSSDGKDTASKDEKNKDTEQTNGKLDANAGEYFAQATTDRQKAHDEVTDMAKEILESAQSSDSAKAEAVARAADLAIVIEQQSNIENLIKAKGFENCLVFIQNQECSIVVADEDLTEEDVLVIKDLASGQSGIAFDKIKITAV